MQKNIKKGTRTKVLFIVILLLAVSAGISIGYYQPFKKDQQPVPISLDEKSADIDKCVAEQVEEGKMSKEEIEKSDITEVVTKAPEVKPSVDYSNLYPNLYVTRPSKQFSPQKTAFLTFDDGPSDRTAEVLDILKQNKIKATFFVIGNTSQKGKELMRRIVAEGHAIAPHTYTHKLKQIYASVESFLEDFNSIYNLIYETTGQKPGIFRFAGGSKNGFNKGNFREIISEMRRRGFDYFDWNISSGDAMQKALTPTQTCMANVVKNSALRNNVVVLMHDAKAKTTTVQALPSIIEGLKNQGFKFNRLSHDIFPEPYSLIKPYV
ncbi:MAG: Peptidoglycan-N-acetylglucosamine deacetylase [Eubacteriales bacterium SKADARSKE-1]|nr:Peptidoglycan-N-acetylglucosamine deacetylase [Eubacteriales bacterium SKADARSKE-1]